ncbi:MAG: hypothetical protein ABEJ58_04365 [Halodesulfurarchaeum sp.]
MGKDDGGGRQVGPPSKGESSAGVGPSTDELRGSEEIPIEQRLGPVELKRKIVGFFAVSIGLIAFGLGMILPGKLVMGIGMVLLAVGFGLGSKRVRSRASATVLGSLLLCALLALYLL